MTFINEQQVDTALYNRAPASHGYQKVARSSEQRRRQRLMKLQPLPQASKEVLTPAAAAVKQVVLHRGFSLGLHQDVCPSLYPACTARLSHLLPAVERLTFMLPDRSSAAAAELSVEHHLQPAVMRHPALKQLELQLEGREEGSWEYCEKLRAWLAGSVGPGVRVVVEGHEHRERNAFIEEERQWTTRFRQEMMDEDPDVAALLLQRE